MARAIWNEVVVAESDKYEMVEGNVYFPAESVKWEHFKEGDRQYTCPWKGKAAYWDVAVEGKVNKNGAWSYPEPTEAAKSIKGYVAFETGFFGGGIKVEK